MKYGINHLKGRALGLLDIPYVRRVRRNHAIEHATIHILSRRAPGVRLAGRSDGRGLFLYGDLPTEDVRAAVENALARIPGEPELAVHPMCGTNMVVGGLVAGLAALAASVTMSGDRRPVRAVDALPRFILAGTLASLASRPLGPLVQRRLTTLPQTANVRIKDIDVLRRGRHVIHRVILNEDG